MKQFLFILISFCLQNCSTQNADNQKTDQLIERITEKTEQINMDSTAAENSDINFESFLSEFSTNKEFQLIRVDFPLRVIILDIEDKEETLSISKDEWQHENLLDTAHIETHDVDAYSQTIHVVKTEAIIKQRGIDNGIKIDYKFELRDGLWYLKEIINAST